MALKRKVALPKPDGNRGRATSTTQVYLAIKLSFLQLYKVLAKRILVWIGCQGIAPKVVAGLIKKGGLSDV